MQGDWFMSLIRSFLAFIDCSVYTLISWAYELLLYLANLDLFGITWGGNGSIISQFSGKIYSLLCVFMLFRLAFSLLQYMVDPNKFYDEKKGSTAMVKHVIVSLLLIVSVPIIFQKAFEVQGIILEQNVLGQLILGETNSGIDSTTKKSVNHETAVDMQFLVLGTFMSIDTTVVPSCKDGPVLGTVSMALAGENEGDCLREVSEIFDTKKNISIDTFFATTKDTGESERSIWSFQNIINAENDEGNYVINYMAGISTVVGLVIVFLLGTFCVDVAMRVVKLGFLELIAPIPIVAYMGPTDKESGMLSKWGK